MAPLPLPGLASRLFVISTAPFLVPLSAQPLRAQQGAQGANDMSIFDIHSATKYEGSSLCATPITGPRQHILAGCGQEAELPNAASAMLRGDVQSPPDPLLLPHIPSF